jgi:hypothetical protein
LNLSFLESAIAQGKIDDGLGFMEKLANLYEMESKSKKDSHESKLLFKKSQEIRQAASDVLNKKIPFNLKIIKMIRS